LNLKLTKVKLQHDETRCAKHFKCGKLGCLFPCSVRHGVLLKLSSSISSDVTLETTRARIRTGWCRRSTTL